MTSERSVALAGPDVRASGVTFRVADPDDRFAGVRLVQDVRVPGDRLEFARARVRVGARAGPPPGVADGVSPPAAAPRRRPQLDRGGLRPGQSAAGAGSVRGQVGRRVPGLFDPHLTGLLAEVWG